MTRDLIYSVCVLKVPLEGSVSQIFDLGLSFYSMTKKRVTFGIYLKHFFLDCIE